MLNYYSFDQYSILFDNASKEKLKFIFHNHASSAVPGAVNEKQSIKFIPYEHRRTSLCSVCKQKHGLF